MKKIRKWWDIGKKEPIKHVLWGIAVLVLVGLIFVVFLGYYNSWAWVGVVEYVYEKGQLKEVGGTKTLWDWLDLLVVPLFIALAAILINQVIQQKQTEIADEQQFEQALKDYFRTMSRLLLKHDLYHTKRNDDVRFIAMAYTNNILRQLDSKRKGFVLDFLFTTDLIRCQLGADWKIVSSKEKPRPIIAITKTDLTKLVLPEGLWGGAKLSQIYLKDVDLTQSDFSRADLSESVLQSCWFQDAKLEKTNLSKCDLRFSVLLGANLKDADLSNANLERVVVLAEELRKAKTLEGCIMYDGSVYDSDVPLAQQTFDQEIPKNKN